MVHYTSVVIEFVVPHLEKIACALRFKELTVDAILNA